MTSIVNAAVKLTLALESSMDFGETSLNMQVSFEALSWWGLLKNFMDADRAS